MTYADIPWGPGDIAIRLRGLLFFAHMGITFYEEVLGDEPTCYASSKEKLSFLLGENWQMV